MANTKSEKLIYSAVGRRKSSVARVFLTPGKGEIVVNGKKIDEYFPHKVLILDAMQPLAAISAEGKYDIKANIVGGGYNGQTGALRLGIARALVKANDANKPVLRAKGLLTVDARVVERKKYGLRKARKDKQFSKR
ncbi:MAG: 30S ribosomal protein S9 [Candidatus Enterosoma sp.]|nr:30S ribosomal protein S9 [Bacilli bacterium]MDD7181344.1 30S ribosomal protein S9 [Bacilli bacterium]MDY3046639.1 30S ribosomal protein S9 [Candidatus Enterosoma sp.]